MAFWFISEISINVGFACFGFRIFSTKAYLVGGGANSDRSDILIEIKGVDL
jgi:hypothetical protein